MDCRSKDTLVRLQLQPKPSTCAMSETAWSIDIVGDAGEELRPPTRVKISGLSSRPELNGRVGNIVRRHDSGRGRYGVRLGESFAAVRPQNLAVRRITRVDTFLAAHVRNELCLEGLRHALRSIVRQTSYAHVFLSWSAESAELSGRVRSILDEFFEKHERAFHYEQPGRFSLFEHYRFLARRLGALLRSVVCEVGVPTSWILFCTAADIWHPRRLASYCKALEQMDEERRASCGSVTCAWHVVRNAADGAAPTAAGGEAGRPAGGFTSAKDVAEQLQAGAARLVDTALPEDADCAHWCSMVRLELLRRFIRLASAPLISSCFCEHAFSRFSRHAAHGARAQRPLLPCRLPYVAAEPPAWLYARGCSDAPLTLVADPSAADRAEAERGCGLCAALSARYGPLDGERALARRHLVEAARLGSAVGGDESRLSAHFAGARRTAEALSAAVWADAHACAPPRAAGEADELGDGERAERLADAAFAALEADARRADCEVSFDAAIYLQHTARPLREALRAHGVPLAELVADAFEARCGAAWERARLALESEAESGPDGDAAAAA